MIYLIAVLLGIVAVLLGALLYVQVSTLSLLVNTFPELTKKVIAASGQRMYTVASEPAKHETKAKVKRVLTASEVRRKLEHEDKE